MSIRTILALSTEHLTTALVRTISCSVALRQRFRRAVVRGDRRRRRVSKAGVDRRPNGLALKPLHRTLFTVVSLSTAEQLLRVEAALANVLPTLLRCGRSSGFPRKARERCEVAGGPEMNVLVKKVFESSCESVN